jgi:hypothetical protein
VRNEAFMMVNIDRDADSAVAIFGKIGKFDPDRAGGQHTGQRKREPRITPMAQINFRIRVIRAIRGFSVRWERPKAATNKLFNSEPAARFSPAHPPVRKGRQGGSRSVYCDSQIPDQRSRRRGIKPRFGAVGEQRPTLCMCRAASNHGPTRTTRAEGSRRAGDCRFISCLLVKELIRAAGHRRDQWWSGNAASPPVPLTRRRRLPQISRIG